MRLTLSHGEAAWNHPSDMADERLGIHGQYLPQTHRLAVGRKSIAHGRSVHRQVIASGHALHLGQDQHGSRIEAARNLQNFGPCPALQKCSNKL